MEAAYCKISASLYCFEIEITFCTWCEPFVSVPVLSKMIVVSLREFSNAVRLRINKPFVAAIEVDKATTKGMATPNAWGQEVTITVTILSRANARLFSTLNQ